MNRSEQPTGIEELLALAVADGRFAVVLLEDRQRAIAASGVSLSSAQRHVLASVSEQSLREMILGLAGTRPEEHRRAFLGRSAAALTALAGGSVLASGSGCTKNRDAGKAGAVNNTPRPAADPDLPPPAPDSRQAVQPDKAAAPQPPPTKHPGETTGIRPDYPKTLGSGGYTGSRPGQIHGLLGTRPAHRVKASSPQVQGGLNPEIVRRIIRRHLNELRYCYQKEAQKEPGLAGTVKVSWTITPTGVVSAVVKDSSDLGNPAAERCIVSAVKRWLFPRPSDGKQAKVTMGWTFWTEKKKGKR